MKHNLLKLLFQSLIILGCFFCSCNSSKNGNKTSETTSADNLASTGLYARIATWNIRILSDGSRDDAELQQIASVFDNFDFVAIQEVRDTKVLDRLKTFLPGWDYIVSDEVGNSVMERYACFYNTALFTSLGYPYILEDINNSFIREPFVAHFRTGNFDYTVITIHTLYGDNIAERRIENALLDDVISVVDAANGNENDVILMGDFNLPADDPAWEITTHFPVMPGSLMTTITDTGSYDNIWVNKTYTSENNGNYSLIKFDEIDFLNDDAAASLAVSDHRPLVCFFSTVSDDDSEGNWNQTAGLPINSDP